jgi:hypothetical protein
VRNDIHLLRPSTNCSVNLLAYRPLDEPKGKLVGFADLSRMRVRLIGCACHPRDGNRWVQPPSRPMFDREGLPLRDPRTGRIGYQPVLTFDDKDMLRHFSEVGCHALDAYAPGWDRP